MFSKSFQISQRSNISFIYRGKAEEYIFRSIGLGLNSITYKATFSIFHGKATNLSNQSAGEDKSTITKEEIISGGDE